MMESYQTKNFQIEQDLLNCGLSADSINSIRDTAVITRNGSQHVVPNSQTHLDESGRQTDSPLSSSVESSDVSSSMLHRLHEQQKMFSRYKQYSDTRIATLERNLSSTMDQLKELHTIVVTLKSNQQAQTRVAIPSPQTQVSSMEPVQQATTQQQVTPQQTPAKSVDRNGIAPVDVQVENIFYCGER